MKRKCGYSLIQRNANVKLETESKKDEYESKRDYKRGQAANTRLGTAFGVFIVAAYDVLYCIRSFSRWAISGWKPCFLWAFVSVSRLIAWVMNNRPWRIF